MRVCIGLTMLAAYFCPWTGGALILYRHCQLFQRLNWGSPFSLKMPPLVHCSRSVGLLLDNSKYHLAHRLSNTRFYGVCRNYTNFLYLIPILLQFRIIKCNRQAALHSALFNYTPLVIGGPDKNKQLTIIEPTQTGINRHKQTFCIMKSSEPPPPKKKYFKNQPHPLVRPSFVHFCQNVFKIYLTRQSL